MRKARLVEALRLSGDSLIAAVLFAVALTVFLLAPIHEVTDSAYSMLASESLLKHHTFALDPYAVPRLRPKHWVDYVSNGEMYTIELAQGHLYYFFPPGNVVLSAPFVAVFNAFGISPANADGTYNPEGEEKIEYITAAVLMAALAAIFFFTSRLLLPRGWSIVIALGGAFGTQVLSTASRALWGDTWGTLLLGIALWMILRRETRQGEMNGVVLATLLAWLYFVRPTYSVHIIVISVYIPLCQRKYFARYALTGAVWLALFVAYSWYHFQQLLPTYYHANRLYFGVFWTALAANLISPGRGLLVYVPVLLFIAYLLIRYARSIAYPRMVVMALFVTVFHLAVMSSFDHWWGGYSFGPRFSTGLVPWFVLLAILGVQARRISLATAGPTGFSEHLELGFGAVLLLLSVAINGLGAADYSTQLWNVTPANIDLHPERNWDWRQPQFLAGLIRPPFPGKVPIAPARLHLAKPKSELFLWYGWSAAESEFRWTDGNEAALVFRLASPGDLVMTINTLAFVTPGNPRQRVTVVLNGTAVGSFEIKDNVTHELKIEAPAAVLKDQNVLSFNLPDATSPKSLSLGKDYRKLGLAVYWLKFEAK